MIICIDGQMDDHMYRWIDDDHMYRLPGRIYGQMMIICIDGQIDRWMDGWLDRWMNGRVLLQVKIDRQIILISKSIPNVVSLQVQVHIIEARELNAENLGTQYDDNGDD